MTAPSISLVNLSKEIGAVRVLDGVNLDIFPGEILALMGENGAGKSTLLNIVSGAIEATGGSIEKDGARLRFTSPIDAFAQGIRVVHQEPDIIPELSVAENIFLGDVPTFGRTRIVNYRQLHEDTRRLFGRFRVGQDIPADMPAKWLSPAQRQIVEILRALRAEPQILAFDEPTSSLTEEETEELFRVIGDLRASGICLIYVSHRMREIRRLADRVAVLRDGALVGVLASHEIEERTIVRLMVGREIDSALRNRSHAQESVALKLESVKGPWLEGISLTIKKGEVVGLAGLMGAGRSEVARTIFGAAPILSGALSLFGEFFAPANPTEAIARGVGYLPEERKAEALFLLLSVRENISLTSLRALTRFRFVQPRSERSLTGRYADDLRIRCSTLEQPIGELSGGNQQKAVLARWLAIGPGVLILDEPTRGIDVGAKAEIYRLIDQLVADGVAILLISSELPEILGLSDRIYVMQRGRITGELSREEASEESILRLAMADDLDPQAISNVQ